MRILITGSNGFIFSHVVRQMLKDDSSFVVGIDILYPCSTRELQTDISGKYVFVHGDINDTDLVRSLLLEHKIELVIHAAAQSHVGSSFTSPFLHLQDNVRGTLSVLEAIRSIQHSQTITTIHISSDEVYGDVCDGSPKHEASLLAPTSVYSATKSSSEMISQAFQKSYNLPIKTIRPNNIFGQGQFFEKCVPRFILLLKEGKPITIQGSGEQRRSFLFLPDFFEALMCIIKHGVAGEIYNVASEHEITINALAQKIADVMGCGDSFTKVHITDRPFNDTRYWVEGTKLMQLGWSQKTSFEEGLKQTVKWYTQRDQSDYFMGTYNTDLSPNDVSSNNTENVTKKARCI